MKKPHLRILVLDDDPGIVRKLSHYLNNKDFESFTAEKPSQALEILEKERIDICLIDLMLPEMNGLELLKTVQKRWSDLEVILISGHGNMDTVIEAMHFGALDFLKKPFNFQDLDLALARSERYLALQNKLHNIESHCSLITRELENSIEKEFIGNSPKMREVLDLTIAAGQDNDISVLIKGENGTGKEIIARIIHYTSARKGHPFFPVNSTAIPDSLLESEFFGHRKGAFTDAREDKNGFFELADGGTLFLDEIADMPVHLQSKLLRAIEEKKIRPLGSEKIMEVDTRIISATNRDIDKMIEEDIFRKDFYHRINTFIIEIPPLRERPEDIEPLLRHYIQYFAKRKNLKKPNFDEQVLEKLKNYHFPGNVRELKNIVERAFIISKNSTLKLSDFLLNDQSDLTNENKGRNLNLYDNEKLLIQEALEKANFNQIKAAKYLGLSRDALIRRMRKFKISIDKSIDF
jgi:DNA-binding NtrC family response regulator